MKKKRKASPLIHEDKPVTPEDYVPVMFFAGTALACANTKGLLTNDQRFALCEASRYLKAYGEQLYREYQKKKQ